MVTTLNLSAEIPETRELRITLPADVPTGHAEIVLLVSTGVGSGGVGSGGSTLGDLAASEFAGIWADRADIGDSALFARHLRETAWNRPV